MESEESRLVPGYRLDRYELLCPIASGGMASVWLARLRGKGGFEKLFAIKTIKADLVWDSNLQEMFLDEARIASRIVHPNVAQILELGEQDGILYIVMEWIDGDSLSQLSRLALKRKSKLPLAISLRLIADVCAGLHAAHQLKERDGEALGVVHRDVSPQNILVTTEGTAKVIDFGLAKARGRMAGPTQSGIVKGKIRYMAPEQVEATAIDHRVDVWAAGMCLYELVIGKLPYDDEDDLQVVKRLMSSDPRPSFDIAVLPEVQEILEQALVGDPEGRFESCAAMKRAIETAMHELDLRTGQEDVAEYIAKTLPDLAAKRAKTVKKAMEAADVRDQVEAPPESSTGEALQLTRRRDSATSTPPPPDTAETKSASRTTSAISLKEQLGERQKRSGMSVWVVTGIAVAAVGGWILWPQSSGTPSTPSVPSARSSVPASSAAPPASAADTIEIDGMDAGASTRPSSNANRHPITGGSSVAPSSSVAARDAAAPAASAAPTYNPAYSILTNPPVFPSAAPPTSAAPPASAPAPEPPRPDQ